MYTPVSSMLTLLGIICKYPHSVYINMGRLCTVNIVWLKIQLCRKEVPGTMAELAVKYKLGADSLLLKDLVTERDFLAERLSIPEHLLQVISWGDGSIVITYWIVRDLLPLAELALCREDVRAELIQHGVEEVYLDSHVSDHHGQVCFRKWLIQHIDLWYSMNPFSFNAGGPITAVYAL